MPIFGDLADDDFAKRLTEYYTTHIGEAEFKNIRAEAKKANVMSDIFVPGPHIIKGIQNGDANPNQYLINRAVNAGVDVVRMSKTLASTKGLLHLAETLGFFQMNARKDMRLFNPLSTPLNTLTAPFGFHQKLPIGLDYLSPLNVAKDFTLTNRLYVLQTQMFGQYLLAPTIPGQPVTNAELTSPPIPISSGPGGPNSFMGIGATIWFTSNSGNVVKDATIYNTFTSPYLGNASPGPGFGKHVTIDGQPIVPDGNQRKDGPVTLNKSFYDIDQDAEQSTGLAKYKTLTYQNLKKDGPNDKFPDFRKKSNYHGITLPDYNSDNMATRLGLPNYGNLNGNQEDSLNDDLVLFMLGSQQFRAYLEGGITDTLSFDWSEYSYVGNSSPNYAFGKSSRAFSFDLKIPAFSAKDSQTNTNKVNKLLQECSPSISSNRAKGQILKLTIGDYITDQSVVIQNITVTVDGDTSWDIGLGDQASGETTGKQLPMLYGLAISGKMLGSFDSTTKFIEGAA